MGSVDEYLLSLAEEDRSAVARVYTLALETVPEATQGTGYGMAALIYRSRPLIAVKRSKAHFGVYPFSADVVSAATGGIPEHVAGKGTIRFTLEVPLPDAAIRAVILARRDEIDRLS